jgi:hypothetical protein
MNTKLDRDFKMELPPKVKIREVAPRDGFQSLKVFLPTEKKLQIIKAKDLYLLLDLITFTIYHFHSLFAINYNET